jgi:hypothetical protein
MALTLRRMTVPNEDIAALVHASGHMLQAPALTPPSPTWFIPCPSPQRQAYDDCHNAEKQQQRCRLRAKKAAYASSRLAASTPPPDMDWWMGSIAFFLFLSRVLTV